MNQRPCEAEDLQRRRQRNVALKTAARLPPDTSQFKMLNIEKKKRKCSQVLEGPLKGPRLFQCLDLYLLPSTPAEQIHVLEKSGANKCGKRTISTRLEERKTCTESSTRIIVKMSTFIEREEPIVRPLFPESEFLVFPLQADRSQAD